MYRNTKLIAIRAGIITVSFTLMLMFNTHTYAWHENLGIDAKKAAELYQTKPNDPAIIQWKTALQLAINGMGECFDISDYQKVIDCQSTISTIVSNCKSHPNTLLACNDARLPQYPTVLKNAKEAQIKFGMQQKELEKNNELLRVQAIGMDTLRECIVDGVNSTSKFRIANSMCEGSLDVIRIRCDVPPPQLPYCKDERFVWYLNEHNMLNSTQHNITNSNITGYENATRVANETVVPVVPQ